MNAHRLREMAAQMEKQAAEDDAAEPENVLYDWLKGRACGYELCAASLRAEADVLDREAEDELNRPGLYIAVTEAR